MSEKCGDYGGSSRDGSPCGRPAGWGRGEDVQTGQCRDCRELPVDPEELAKLAGYMLSQDQIADYFEVPKSTLDNWFSKFDELREAYKNARARTQKKVAASIMQRATGVPKDGVARPNPDDPDDWIVQPSDTMAMFVAKTQLGWQETKGLDIDGDIDQTVRRDEVESAAEDYDEISEQVIAAREEALEQGGEVKPSGEPKENGDAKQNGAAE